MIHSMCGGKLNQDDTKIFAKVAFLEGTKSEKPFGWFLVEDIAVAVGDTVVVPVNYLREEGEVIEVVECKNRVYPVPVRTAKSIVSVK